MKQFATMKNTSLENNSKFENSIRFENQLRHQVLGSLIVFFLFQSTAVLAQDSPVEACEAAVRILRDDGDINAALEEARWCVEGLEALKQQNTLGFFPDQVGTWVAGEVTNSKIFGMSMLEREYTRDGATISVSLATGGGGTGLMALAQAGMQLGGEVLQKFRVDRQTVLNLSNDKEARFLVQLQSGGILNITSVNALTDSVKSFVTDFPVGELNDALVK